MHLACQRVEQKQNIFHRLLEQRRFSLGILFFLRGRPKDFYAASSRAFGKKQVGGTEVAALFLAAGTFYGSALSAFLLGFYLASIDVIKEFIHFGGGAEFGLAMSDALSNLVVAAVACAVLYFAERGSLNRFHAE